MLVGRAGGVSGGARFFVAWRLRGAGRAAARAAEGGGCVVGQLLLDVRPGGAGGDARFSGAWLPRRRAAGRAGRDPERRISPAARARRRAVRSPAVRRRQAVAQPVRRCGRRLGRRAGTAPHAAPLRGRGARRRLQHQLRLPAAGPARRRGAARRSALWGGPPPARVYGARVGLLSRGTGGSPVGASAGRTRRGGGGYNSTMRRSLVLLSLLVGPATRVPAQSPAERAAIEALRDSLTAAARSAAWQRFVAAAR